MIGRSVVIHGAGKSRGQIQFLQGPVGQTSINVSLSNLDSKASSFHVHILPIKASGDPCSDENIMGHFNPLAVSQSTSPAPGTGTVDQYEIGDITGKFGLLTNLTQVQKQYIDNNMPLSGPNSIVGRSLVIHYLNDLLCSSAVPLLLNENQPHLKYGN
uniref:Superoxide dismutase copper/zinc binding domain-containing protein n=1 Tax=Scleropages formosus TaxID=113540 RepID=A0A8C9R868_SCLFO